jgi:uncharacterized RDD family membrane protein YckC
VADIGAQPAYRHAGFWWRALALFIDGLILGVLAAIVDGAGAGLTASMSDGPGQEVAYRVGVTAPQAAGHGTNLLINWLYFAVFESSRWSATPGKRLLGMVVIDAAGRRISFGRATGRFFAKILSGLIFGIGFMMAGWNERKRALHDMIAGTLVMRRAPTYEPIVPPDAVV